MLRLVAMTALMAASSPPPAERVVTADGVTTTIVVDGVTGQLRVDPAAPGLPLLTQAFADRVGLKMNRRLGIGFIYSVGPTRVSASTRVARVAFGGAPAKQRLGWAGRRFSGAVDGSVGPAGLPEPVVRFVLRSALPGERTVSLPMEEIGFPLSLFGGGWSATHALIEVDGRPMRVLFDPGHARSLANATAAVRLARAFDGTLSGDPTATEIAFGIERPVRGMTLARPLPVGALMLSSLGVRIPDAGTSQAIPEAGAKPAPIDPSEVVVTAKGKKPDWHRDLLSLGADALARCSAIVFDKPAKQIRLTCG